MVDQSSSNDRHIKLDNFIVLNQSRITMRRSGRTWQVTWYAIPTVTNHAPPCTIAGLHGSSHELWPPAQCGAQTMRAIRHASRTHLRTDGIWEIRPQDIYDYVCTMWPTRARWRTCCVPRTPHPQRPQIKSTQPHDMSGRCGWTCAAAWMIMKKGVS